MKLWSIQILRFVAALGVVGYHAGCVDSTQSGHIGIATYAFGRTGAAGVDLFFVISGLIIARTSKDLTAPQFIAKRARRILPLYWVACMPWIVGAVIHGTFGWREGLATLALWPATDRMTAPALSVGWTLCFEALFYAAFALVLWRRWLLGPILGVFGSCLFVGHAPIPNFLGNPLVLEFLVGVGLAKLPRFPFAVWAAPLGVALLIVLAPYAELASKTDIDLLVGNGVWPRVLAFGLPSALIVWSALQFEAREGALTRLGDASYAIYLFHPLIVVLLAGVLPRFVALSDDAVVMLCLAAASLLGWRLHVRFEKPILDFLSRRPLIAATA